MPIRSTAYMNHGLAVFVQKLLFHTDFHMDFPDSSDGKASAYNAGDMGSIPGSGRSLEKEMATHSSILAWRIPWTEEAGVTDSLVLSN